jgi:adenylosuccinate synthase
MPLSVVTGGFFGDEGKGKIVAYLALKDNCYIAAKAGSGPQSGHTAATGKYTQLLPSAFVNENTRLLLGSGTAIDPNIILNEIKKYRTEDRTGIDGACTIIEPKHIEMEQELKGRIGSVGVGTGFARVDRILRKAKLAKDEPSLEPYITNVSEEIYNAIENKRNVILEGTQGLGLGLFEVEYYPHVTSQNTIASQIASDAYIAPNDIDEIITVFKAYVSRVGHGIGQKPLRTLWTPEEEKKFGIEERGTVSKRKRKLGHFDDVMAVKAIRKNGTTQGALTCIDRLFPENKGVTEFDNLSYDAQQFIEEKNKLLKLSGRHFKGISLISTGPEPKDIIDLRYRI